MRKEYDFSKGVRGKFYKKGVELRLPIYLDTKLHAQMELLAKKKGKDIGQIVNDLLRKDLELIEEFK
jgi:Iap family predicted aminopeptidase